MDDALIDAVNELIGALPRCSYCQSRPGVLANEHRWPLCEECLQWLPTTVIQDVPPGPAWDLREPLAKLRELLSEKA